MRELQRKADTAYVIIGNNGACPQVSINELEEICPLYDTQHCKTRDLEGRVSAAKEWLLNHGFPARRPRIYTVAELSQQIIKGSSVASLSLWIADHVEAVKCPECGEILYRETRKKCVGCGEIYPAGRWKNGEPCECGSMNAKYAGKQTANRFGNLEFRQCETHDCRWNNHYRTLTVQELAGLAAIEADKQRDVKP